MDLRHDDPDPTTSASDEDDVSLEPLAERHVDEVVAQRRADEERARTHGDPAHGGAERAGVEDESSYSTEIEQGASSPDSGSEEQVS
jgi:hypothetical protein